MKTAMNKIGVLFYALLIMVTLTNCKAIKNANNKQKGAAIGAASGAVLGAVIGNNAGEGGKGGEGAAIGAAAGGAAGVLIGAQMDKQAQKIEEEIPGAQVERIDDAIVVTFDEKSGVYFETNKHNINAASQQTLDKLVGVLTEYPETNILVVGHTDSAGSEAYNLKLSKNRAMSVTSYLTSHGISKNRMTTDWYGETQPKHDNSTPEGRAKNRRVNIAVVPNEKMKEDAEKESQGN